MMVATWRDGRTQTPTLCKLPRDSQSQYPYAWRGLLPDLPEIPPAEVWANEKARSLKSERGAEFSMLPLKTQ
jgi:hypothetical protein